MVGFLVLAVANAQKVTVDLVFEEYEVPLAFVIAGTGLLGAVVGWLFGLARSKPTGRGTPADPNRRGAPAA